MPFEKKSQEWRVMNEMYLQKTRENPMKMIALGVTLREKIYELDEAKIADMDEHEKEEFMIYSLALHSIERIALDAYNSLQEIDELERLYGEDEV